MSRRGSSAIGVVLVVLALASCAGPTSRDGRNGAGGGNAGKSALDLSRADVIDLTYAYDAETLYWPTSPSGLELTELSYGPTEGGYFYAAYSFCTPEHGGTHIDAPIHFARDGWTLGEVPVERLIAPGIVIDVADRAAADPDYRLTVDDVHEWEREHGQVPSGTVVLLHTGWGARWPDAGTYLGDDTPGDASNLHFPGYGEASARLLVGERGVVALGIDTASLDHGPSEDFIAHQIAAGANVVGLENIANLDQVPTVGSWIVALPMKIGQGSGGPVRVVALVMM